MDKVFDWDNEKNQKLIKERGISFEAIVLHLESGDLLGIAQGKGKFKHQKQFIVNVNQYIYAVPYVEDENKCFLKTIIPSRRLTKRYFFGGD